MSAPKQSVPEVHHYAGHLHRADEGRPAWLYWRNGVEVQIKPSSGADSQDAIDAAAQEIAEACAGRTRAWSLLVERDEEIARLKGEVSRLRGLVPPARPEQLTRPACVRMDARGLWVLGSREKGWSSFGYAVRDWDELFRRWNVRITEHGTDECGPYWIAEPTAPEASK